MKDKIDCSIMINSCDNYSDIWEPFFTLFNKYFKTDMDVYISLETKKCPYAKTINKNFSLEQRTARIRECLKEIPTKYVIVMDEDCFISEYVNMNEILNCIKYMEEDNNIAQFNFEPTFDKNDLECEYPGWLKRNKNAPYINSFQPSIHNREILIKRLESGIDGWKWELQTANIPYDVYVSKKENRVISYGKELNPIFGIFRGKWYKPHVVPLFEKEGIVIDFEKRGFYD